MSFFISIIFYLLLFTSFLQNIQCHPLQELEQENFNFLSSDSSSRMLFSILFFKMMIFFLSLNCQYFSLLYGSYSLVNPFINTRDFSELDLSEWIMEQH